MVGGNVSHYMHLYSAARGGQLGQTEHKWPYFWEIGNVLREELISSWDTFQRGRNWHIYCAFSNHEGEKIVCEVTPGQNGLTVTTACCMSASGLCASLALIFPRKRMVPDLFPNAPTRALALGHLVGFHKFMTFHTWLQQCCWFLTAMPHIVL
jgi:hypothetical protein